jgi:hypothetical protein
VVRHRGFEPLGCGLFGKREAHLSEVGFYCGEDKPWRKDSGLFERRAITLTYPGPQSGPPQRGGARGEPVTDSDCIKLGGFCTASDGGIRIFYKRLKKLFITNHNEIL